MPVKKVYVIHLTYLPSLSPPFLTFVRRSWKKIEIGDEMLMEFPLVKCGVMFVLVFPF